MRLYYEDIWDMAFVKTLHRSSHTMHVRTVCPIVKSTIDAPAECFACVALMHRRLTQFLNACKQIAFPVIVRLDTLDSAGKIVKLCGD